MGAHLDRRLGKRSPSDQPVQPRLDATRPSLGSDPLNGGRSWGGGGLEGGGEFERFGETVVVDVGDNVAGDVFELLDRVAHGNPVTRRS